MRFRSFFYALSLIATLLPVYASEQGNDLYAPVVPHDHHYALLYLIQDALPNVHYSEKPIGSKVGQGIGLSIVNQLNKLNIIYPSPMIDRFDDEGSRIADLLTSLDLPSLFSLIDSYYLYKISYLSNSLLFAESLTEDAMRGLQLYSSNTIKNGLATPINESHAHVLMKRVVSSRIAHAMAGGQSFVEAKKTLLSRINDERSLLLGQRDAEHYFDLLTHSLLQAYDKHSRYIPASQVSSLKSSYKNKDYRVGLNVKLREGSLVITQIIKDSSADRLGMFAIGDILEEVSINGERLSLKERSPSYLSKLLSESIINENKITFHCKRDSLFYDATVSRSEIDSQALSIEHYESPYHGKDIRYLSIPSFFDGLVEQVKNDIVTNDNSSLVIDLRGNGGGSLVEGIELTSLFMDGGAILTTVDKNGERTFYDEDDFSYNGKVVILVDRNSASASEIMASALQYHERAVIIGEKTYGKGSVQRFIDLSNPLYNLPIEDVNLGAILVTIAKYFSPSGESLHRVGVIPDIEINDRVNTAEDQLIAPIAQKEKYIPQTESWKNKFAHRFSNNMATVPIYRFYVAQKIMPTDNTKPLIQSLNELENSSEIKKQRALSYLNLNRRYKGLPPLSSSSEVNNDDSNIDILLDAVALSLETHNET